MGGRREQLERRDRGPTPGTTAHTGHGPETELHGVARSALGLQRSLGNRAVTALVTNRPVLQRTAAGDFIELALQRVDAILDPERLRDGAGRTSAVRTSRAAVVQRQEPQAPAPPRPGTAGDVVKAVLATPEGTRAVEQVKEKAKADLRALGPGETAAVVSAALAITAPLLVQPESRGFLLDQVSGKKVDIPGLTGVSAKVDFKDGKPTGGMVYFNVATVLPKSWGFRRD